MKIHLRDPFRPFRPIAKPGAPTAEGKIVDPAEPEAVRRMLVG
jgi:hypothetical protein